MGAESTVLLLIGAYHAPIVNPDVFVGTGEEEYVIVLRVGCDRVCRHLPIVVNARRQPVEQNCHCGGHLEVIQPLRHCVIMA